MTDTQTNPVVNLIQDAVESLGKVLFRQQKDLITHLRQPTPINPTFVVQADANGVIGGGFNPTVLPSPVTLFQCPMSHEAWVNRISIRSPGRTPTSPLTQGQVLVTGTTTDEVIFFLPLAGQVAPVLITEGRLSAAQLNPGEKMILIADGLPANTALRFDFQIVLVTGVSEYTPRSQSGPDQGILD